MNKVILMGRLTRDPEMRLTPQGTAVAQFTTAVNRRFGKSGEADFINCVAWRQTAEFIGRYFHKGKMIALEGSIQTRTWDGKDGKKQYATEVIADAVYFCEKEKRTSPGDGYQPMPSYDEPQGYKPDNGFEEVDDEASEDDIPF